MHWQSFIAGFAVSYLIFLLAVVIGKFVAVGRGPELDPAPACEYLDDEDPDRGGIIFL